MEKIRVLLVEDDMELSMVTKLQLESEDYEVTAAYDGAGTLKAVETGDFDVILLDVMLPDTTGHELCEKIRPNFDGCIIFMSCLDDGGNVVNAFREGGNDYLIKPVRPEDLTERIQKNLEQSRKKHVMVFKQFIINRDVQAVYENRNDEQGDDLRLSSTEYKLLMAFVERPEELLLYKDLYQVIWEKGEAEDIRTLMVHISNLRKKIDYMHQDSIRAVRGAGYIFSDR